MSVCPFKLATFIDSSVKYSQTVEPMNEGL